MAKSQIIKDIANGSIDTYTALKRTKVLLQGLNNETILVWLNNELEGYQNADIVPDYRKIDGQLYGTYLKGSIASHIQYRDVSLPLGNMPENLQHSLLTANITEGIGALKEMVAESNDSAKKSLRKQLPADTFPYLAQCNDDPYMVIISAYVALSIPQVLNIFSRVENILLDILFLLEKQFGNLDDMDIDTTNKSEKDLNEIIRNIQIIYNDHSITMGDNNKITDSTVASSESSNK